MHHHNALWRLQRKLASPDQRSRQPHWYVGIQLDNSHSGVRKAVDPDMKQTLAWRSNKTRQPALQERQGISNATKCLWVQWDRLQLDNGVLYCQWKTKVGNGTRLQSAITKSMLLKVRFAPSKKVVTWSPCSKQDLGAITRMLLLVWPETWCLRLVATVWKVLTLEVPVAVRKNTP